MKPPPFAYTRPETLDEALSDLAKGGDEAKVLAGGQSLIPLLAFRMARPARLTDITRLPGLDRIDFMDGGKVSIGALTTHRSVETNEELRQRCPAIFEAVSQIGHIAIRNRGTVGGSVAHADPAAEWPALALMFDASFDVRSSSGSRRIPASDMFVSFMTSALAPDELLVGMEFSLPAAGTGTAFREVSRRHGDFAMAGAGALVGMSDGGVSEARIALMAAGLTAVRASEAEEMLVGQEPNDELLRAAARSVEAAIDPLDDLHGSAEYKRHLAEVMAYRALVAAFERSEES